MFSGRFKWFYNVVVFNTKPASDENVDAVSGGRHISCPYQ